MKHLLLLICLLLPAQVWGTTYYTDYQCSNGTAYVPATRACTGGSATVRQTVIGGIGLLSAGDSLYIRAGTYVETVATGAHGSSGSPIIIKRYPGDAVVLIDGPSSGYGLTIGHNYTTVDDISIESSEVNVLISNDASNSQLTNCVVRYAYAHGILVMGSYNTVSGCTITENVQSNAARNQAGWGTALGSYYGTSHITFESNLVYYNHGEGISAFTFDGDGANDWVVRGNTVYDNWAVNIYCNGCQDSIIEKNIVYVTEGVKNPANRNSFPTGIAISSETGNAAVSGLTIRNNLVFNNHNPPESEEAAMAGLELFTDRTGSSFTYIDVYNNTFVDNGNGIYFNVTHASTTFSNLNIRNNISTVPDVAYALAIGVKGAPANTVISNNCYYPTSTGGSGHYYWTDTYYTYANWLSASGDTYSMEDDPEFVSPGSDNYQLQATSPCKDAGATLASVPTDILGVARPRGLAYDIGAYEYPSSTGSFMIIASTKPIEPDPLSTILRWVSQGLIKGAWDAASGRLAASFEFARVK